MAADPVSSGLKKKIGPLTTGGWLAAGGAIGAVVLVYRYYKNYEANAAANAAATTATTPTDTTPTSTGATGPATYSSVNDWLAAVVAALTANGVTGADALDWASKWLNGTCVTSKGYNALSSIIATVGLPPGYGASTPTLTACGGKSGHSGGGGNGKGGRPTSPTSADKKYANELHSLWEKGGRPKIGTAAYAKLAHEAWLNTGKPILTEAEKKASTTKAPSKPPVHKTSG
jgi:hypothetical protein